MARPFKCRRVLSEPSFDYFKPRGIPVARLEEVALTVDEFEAVRLADLECMYQERAAERMKISRQTFGNILGSAHHKIADCLVNGKAIKIEGGVFEMETKRNFSCSACNHEWAVPHGTGRPGECPECGSRDIHRAPQDRGYARQGRGRGRRRRGAS